MSYYPAHVYLQSASAALPDPPQDRFCSVKGCAKRLPQDYTLKMCDQCRGRHRIYATTKRAKRKMEKLAVIQNTVNLADPSTETQSVAWMPPDALSEPAPPQASSSRFDQPEEFTTHIWATQIDPRLFNPKSSELAGALTLPPINPPSVSNDPDAVFDPHDGNQPASTPGPASTSKLPPPSASGLPPRYCSVKGCKAIISGDYLFKMCESCRDRYRGYGNTKRVKWKRERESAMAELDRMRETEDRRRADAGLPPISELPPAERRAWEGNVVLGVPPSSEPDSTDSTLPVRMCTVSHCHAVLPTNYEFRRCEQHRLQNRHHSKLKRVRDKESKLVPIFDDRRQPPQQYGDGDDHERGGTRERSEMPSEADDERPSILGIPPAARGLRRSNHVCTIKWCHNLLDPSSPWKMCEAHREKDRAQRRRKAERDRENQRAQEESGGMVFVNTTPTREGSVIVGDVDGQETTYGEEALETGDQDTFERVNSAELQSVVFMDPLLPPEFECPEPQTSDHLEETVPMVPTVEDVAAQNAESTLAPPKKRMRLNNDQPIKRRLKAVKVPEKTVVSAAATTANPDVTANDVVSGSPAASSEVHGSTTPEVDSQHQTELASRPPSTVPTQPATPAPAASAPVSASTPAPGASPATPAAPVQAPNAAASASDGTAANNAAHIQPQFQVPYYMPPPFSMSYPLAQPPFYTPSPFPIPYPFPAFQPSPFAPPPPGFMYPAPGAWGMFGAAGLGVMAGGPNAEAPRAAPPEAKKRKRASRAKEKDSGLKIVMVAPGPSHPSPPPMGSLADPSGVVQETTFHWVEPKHPPVPVGPPSPPPLAPVSTPTLVPIPPPAPVLVASRAPATVPPVASITATVPAPAQPPAASPTPAARKCGGLDCHRTIPADTQGTICEHCRARIKRRQEKAKMRHRLEPRRAVAGKKGVAA